MTNTHIDMKKIKQLFRHYTSGMSKRVISKRVHVSRNIVKKYISLLKKSKLTSDCDLSRFP